MKIIVISVQHEDKGHFQTDEEELFHSGFKTSKPCVVITEEDLTRLQNAASCKVKVEIIGSFGTGSARRPRQSHKSSTSSS